MARHISDLHVRSFSLLAVCAVFLFGCSSTVNDPVPDVPVLVAPDKGNDDEADTVELIWDAGLNAEHFGLQVSTRADFSDLVVDEPAVRGHSHILYDLPLGKTYYWRVRANNEVGSSGWTETWSFTSSVEAEIPPVPSLSLPADSTQNMPQTVYFSWSPSDGATRYHIQVSLEENFIRRSADIESVRGTSQRIHGLVPTYIYYWRVRAANPLGFSTWSPTRRLVIEDEAW